MIMFRQKHNIMSHAFFLIENCTAFDNIDTQSRFPNEPKA